MMYMQFFGIIFIRNNKILNNSGKISKQIQSCLWRKTLDDFCHIPEFQFISVHLLPLKIYNSLICIKNETKERTLMKLTYIYYTSQISGAYIKKNTILLK